MIELADNLFRTGYKVMGDPLNKYMPMYPFLIALAHNFLGLNYRFAIRVIPLVASLLLPFILFLWPGEKEEERKARLFSVVLISISGLDLIYSSQPDTCLLFSFFSILGFFWLRKNKNFLAGMGIGFAWLTRPEGQLALLAGALFSLKHPKKLLSLILGFLLASSPWLIWTWKEFGRPGGQFFYLLEFFIHPGHTGLKFFSEQLIWIGPLALGLALVGGVRSEKNDQILLALYVLFYSALHIWWWHNAKRFAEPLLWITYLFAGEGIFYLWERVKAYRARWRRGLIFLMIMMGLEQLVIGVVVGKEMKEESSDPYLEAHQSLAEVKDGKIMSSNLLMAKFETGKEVIELSKYQEGEDPHLFILKKVLNENARWLIWCSSQAYDYNYFHYLSEGGFKKVPVFWNGTEYLLIYDFYRVFAKGNKLVYIYELSAQPRR